MLADRRSWSGNPSPSPRSETCFWRHQRRSYGLLLCRMPSSDDEDLLPWFKPAWAREGGIPKRTPPAAAPPPQQQRMMDPRSPSFPQDCSGNVGALTPLCAATPGRNGRCRCVARRRGGRERGRRRTEWRIPTSPTRRARSSWPQAARRSPLPSPTPHWKFPCTPLQEQPAPSCRCELPIRPYPPGLVPSRHPCSTAMLSQHVTLGRLSSQIQIQRTGVPRPHRFYHPQPIERRQVRYPITRQPITHP